MDIMSCFEDIDLVEHPEDELLLEAAGIAVIAGGVTLGVLEYKYGTLSNGAKKLVAMFKSDGTKLPFEVDTAVSIKPGKVAENPVKVANLAVLAKVSTKSQLDKLATMDLNPDHIPGDRLITTESEILGLAKAINLPDSDKTGFHTRWENAAGAKPEKFSKTSVKEALKEVLTEEEPAPEPAPQPQGAGAGS